MRFILISVLLAVSLSTSACDLNRAGDTLPDTIHVGVAVPLTGPVGSIGQTMQTSLVLAREEMNRTHFRANPLAFIIEDSQSNPDAAGAAYERLIQQDQVTMLIGPATSSSTQAAFPVAQANRVVALSPTAAAAGLGEIGTYVFLANLSVDAVIPGGVRLTQERLGYQRVALVTDTEDLFSVSAAEVLNDAFAANSLNVVASETIGSADTGFGAQLAAIAATNPDAVFISTLPGQVPGILTQARAAGITAQFIIPLAFSSDEATAAGDAAEGVITFSTWTAEANTPGNADFVRRYTERTGVAPNRFAAQWYAAVEILSEAILQAQSVRPGPVREAMAGLTDISTILGPFSFGPDGEAIYDPIIRMVQDGTLVVFD
ncbi:MAG: ABC transporter substrate-binding protein [Rhodothermales bacterium]